MRQTGVVRLVIGAVRSSRSARVAIGAAVVLIAGTLAVTTRPAIAAPSSGGLRVTSELVQVGTQNRGVRLVLPDSARPDAPVVVVFHGGNSSPDEIASTSGFDAVAQREGWIVAYPRGMNGDWNAGVCCARARRQNDVRFFARVIASLRTRGYRARRIAVTGFSQGAFIALRLACEVPGRLTAVGIVAGTLMTSRCSSRRPLPLVSVWGDDDGRVPVAGRLFGSYRMPSARALDRRWRQRNGCRGTTRQEREAVVTWRAVDCPPGGAVATHIVRHTGHAWPRSASGTATFDATDVLRDFMGRQFLAVEPA